MVLIADIHTFDDKLYAEALKLLPEYRREKVLRQRGEADRKRSAAAGLLLNYATAAYESARTQNGHEMNAGEEKLKSVNISLLVKEYNSSYHYHIDYIENGKPVYADRPDICFNLSHSGHYAVCLICNVPSGIDIEGDRTVPFRVADRFFSDRERQWIGESEERFFRIWTLKEAYSKAVGKGVALAVSDVEFVAVHSGFEAYIAGERAENLLIQEFEKERYRIAVVKLPEKACMDKEGIC